MKSLDHTNDRRRAANAARPVLMLLGAAALSAAGVAEAQSVIGWGKNVGQNTPLPAPDDLTAIRSLSCGPLHSIAILPDGTARFWGTNSTGQCSPPADLGVVRRVSAGWYHSVCIKADGSLILVGSNNGYLDVPADLGSVALTATDYFFSAAVRTDGTVAVWGNPVLSVLNVPVGLNRVIKLEAGSECLAAVKADGSLVMWGRDNFGMSTPPAEASVVRDIAVGNAHSIAVLPDGSVRAWGRNNEGQCNVPAPLTAVQVAAGGLHSLALRSDGTVQAWGLSNQTQTTVPASVIGAFDIGAGETFSYAAIRPEGIVAPTITLVSSSGSTCGAQNGAIDVSVGNATSFFWSGPSGFFSLSEDLSLLPAGTYTATANGPGGTATLEVVLSAGADSVAPVVESFNPAMTGQVDANCTTTLPDFTVPVVASDDCTPAVHLVIAQSPAPGTVVGLGTHAVTISVTDGSDNVTTVAATFTASGTLYSYFVDSDSDGYGVTPAASFCTASVPAGYASVAGDCAPSNPAIHPNRPEICDGLDNNCAGGADDGLTFSLYYADADADGFGATDSAPVSSCAPVAGRALNNLDCNDAAAAINPTAVEICDAANADENCNGTADDSDAGVDASTRSNFYRDADADGYTVDAATRFCDQPTGYEAQPEGDCADDDAARFPSAVENCANLGVDNDCDGVNTAAEATDSVAYFVDADQDGFGAGAATMSCSVIAGSVTNSSDCNDSAVMYADGDGDGDGAGAMVNCNGVATNTDCDDANGARYPSAVENCANLGVDNDCDGVNTACLLYTSPSPRDRQKSRMPSSA